MRDLRHAFGGLRREPAFSLTAVGTLALGSGAAVAIFALVNAVLLRPLPYRDPSRVVLLWAAPPGGARTWLSVPELDDLSRDARSFSAVAGLTDLRMNLVADGQPEELEVIAASAALFPLLGVQAAHGALLDAGDDVDGAAPVVVLSDDLWRRRFGGDRGIVGRTITLDGRGYLVRGVLPPGFAILPPDSVFPSRVDAWVALRTHTAARARDIRYLHAIARLAPGVTFDRARDEAASLGATYARAFPQIYLPRGAPAPSARGGPGPARVEGWTFQVVDFHRDVVRQARPVLVALGAIVAVVLVLACVNVANLMLARGERRRRELMVRVALGAGPARLVRLLAAEALVLAAAGCGAGSLLALGVPRLVAALDPAALPRLDAAIVDARLLAFIVTLPGVVAAVFAVVPAIDALRAREAAAVDRALGPSRRSATVGRALAVTQVALAALALVATAMLTEAVLRLQQVPSGFDAGNVLTFRVTLPAAYRTGPEITGFFTRATDRLRAMPGAEQAAAITHLPMSGASLASTFQSWTDVEDRRVDADLRGITPEYFSVMRVPLVAGRAFTGADGPGQPPVAIVDRAFARRLRPDGNVVGMRLRWIRSPGTPIEIVGIAGDVRHRGPAEAARETVYRPAAQYARRAMTFVVRCSPPSPLGFGATGPSSGVPCGGPGQRTEATAAIHEIDPAQPVAELAPLSTIVSKTMAKPRLGAVMGLSLGALALIVAVLGVYGVMSYGVAQRVREFAVRLALGAPPRSILALVMREGLIVTGLGLVGGLTLGPAAAGALRSALYGVGGNDWRAYAAAAFVLAASAALACYLPARRASRGDPMSVLRSE